MTDLVTYSIDDASDDKWEDCNNELSNINLDLIKAMISYTQDNFLYNLLEEAANKCFEVKKIEDQRHKKNESGSVLNKSGIFLERR